MIYPLKEWKVTSRYGNRIHPVTKKESFHNGIDLKAPVGTNVYAPWNGKVTMVDLTDDSSGGLQLRIYHDNGVITGYAHLSSILVKNGEQVVAGQVIAKTGNSGIGTSPHLHFTTRDWDGNTFNPYVFFTKNEEK